MPVPRQLVNRARRLPVYVRLRDAAAGTAAGYGHGPGRVGRRKVCPWIIGRSARSGILNHYVTQLRHRSLTTDRDRSPVCPLVVQHPRSGRCAIFCEPVAMRRLELLPGAQLLHPAPPPTFSWEDSQALVSEVWRRSFEVPGRVLAWEWREGDVVVYGARDLVTV